MSLTPATPILESFGDSGEAFSVYICVGAQFDNVLSRNAKAGIKDSESTAQRQDRDERLALAGGQFHSQIKSNSQIELAKLN